MRKVKKAPLSNPPDPCLDPRWPHPLQSRRPLLDVTEAFMRRLYEDELTIGLQQSVADDKIQSETVYLWRGFM